MTAGVQWNATRSTPEQLAASRRIPDHEVCGGSYQPRRDGSCAVCGQHMGRLTGRADDVAARHRKPAWLIASGRDLEEPQPKTSKVCGCGGPKDKQAARCWNCRYARETREKAKPSSGTSAVGAL
jgi:hypothetical protein